MRSVALRATTRTINIGIQIREDIVPAQNTRSWNMTQSVGGLPEDIATLAYFAFFFQILAAHESCLKIIRISMSSTTCRISKKLMSSIIDRLRQKPMARMVAYNEETLYQRSEIMTLE